MGKYVDSFLNKRGLELFAVQSILIVLMQTKRSSKKSLPLMI